MKILEEIKSPINGRITVVKNLGMKPYIQVGGLTQSGGVVRGVWKSTLKKLQKSKTPKIQSCLILGLGGGTVAGLVRKYWPEAKIVGVEIDPIMVGLGKKYLGLEEVGVDIKIQDAQEFLTTHYSPHTRPQRLSVALAGVATHYDLILVDMYVGDKIPKKFETENYIHRVRSLLARGGVIVFNRLYYGIKRSEAVKFGKLLEKVFPKVTVHYPEANVMFICSK